MPQSGWIPVALGSLVVFHKSWDDPRGDTCTAGAGRFADNQSMSLLNYSSTRKLQVWQIQDQMYGSVYRDRISYISSNSILGRKEAKVKNYFLKVNIGATKDCVPLLMSRSAQDQGLVG